MTTSAQGDSDPSSRRSAEAGQHRSSTLTPPSMVSQMAYDEAQDDSLLAFDRAMAQFKGDAGRLSQAAPVLTHRLTGPLVTDLPHGWPSWLFVPRQQPAVWRSVWYFTPPDANLYAREWLNGDPAWNGSAGFASRDSGELFARALGTTSNPVLWGDAGIGVAYFPSNVLAEITIEPLIRGRVDHRWEVSGGGGAHLSVRERATLFTVCWLVNPANGSFDPAGPFAAVPLLDNVYSGEGGIPLVSSSVNMNGGAGTARFLVQGGREYLIGVVANARLDITITDGSGNPVVNPSFDKFNLWVLLQVTVPSIVVRPSIVYVP